MAIDGYEIGVLACLHVLRGERPVAFVHHEADEDGGWQFLCAADHSADGPDAFDIGGIEHLIAAQPELRGLLDLESGWSAELIRGLWIRRRSGS